MNAFNKILMKAIPVMAAVQSLFGYVFFLSIFGYVIDEKIGTFPFLFILLLFTGLILGFYQISHSTKSRK
tara:strand:- start:280 stop:489 length:210 start_codon:yes stop_codon:yes gene_type:complete